MASGSRKYRGKCGSALVVAAWWQWQWRKRCADAAGRSHRGGGSMLVVVVW